MASEPWLGALVSQTAVGAVPGLLGAGFALTMLWRRRLRLLLTVALTISALYIGHLEQVVQACGALAGLVTGTLMYRRDRPRAGLRGSQHEVRVLVGMLVAVSALGGMLPALAANAGGRMTMFSFLFASSGSNPHNLVAACGHTELAAACRDLREQQLYAQWPGVLVQFAPALLLLLSADGLRRGRRLAWCFAVVINLAVLGVSLWSIDAAGSDPSVHIAVPGAWALATLLAGEVMLLPVVTLVLVLLITRRYFQQTVGRRAARKLTVTLVSALSVSCGAFLLLGYLIPGGTARPRFPSARGRQTIPHARCVIAPPRDSIVCAAAPAVTLFRRRPKLPGSAAERPPPLPYRTGQHAPAVITGKPLSSHADRAIGAAPLE